MERVPVPNQPEELRAAIRAHNRTVRREMRELLAGVLEVTDISKASPELRAAYNAWVDTYNAAVRHNRIVAQTRKNAREVQAVRTAACRVCYATHAGEC